MNVDISDLPAPDLETDEEPEVVRPDTGPLPVPDEIDPESETRP